LLLGVLAIPVIAIIVIGILLTSRPSLSASAGSSIGDVHPAEQSFSKRNGLPNSVETSAGDADTKSHNSTPVESRPDDLKHLPGASPFVTAGVIRDLQLTDAQLAKIRRILAGTDQAIMENAECRLLFDTARQEVLNLLNSQQRQRWAAYNGAGALLTDGDHVRDPDK